MLEVGIPEGALPEGTLVTIAVARDAPSGSIGSAYELGPSHVVFDKPMLLYVQATGHNA